MTNQPSTTSPNASAATVTQEHRESRQALRTARYDLGTWVAAKSGLDSRTARREVGGALTGRKIGRPPAIDGRGRARSRPRSQLRQLHKQEGARSWRREPRKHR